MAILVVQGKYFQAGDDNPPADLDFLIAEHLPLPESYSDTERLEQIMVKLTFKDRVFGPLTHDLIDDGFVAVEDEEFDPSGNWITLSYRCNRAIFAGVGPYLNLGVLLEIEELGGDITLYERNTADVLDTSISVSYETDADFDTTATIISDYVSLGVLKTGRSYFAGKEGSENISPSPNYASANDLFILEDGIVKLRCGVIDEFSGVEIIYYDPVTITQAGVMLINEYDGRMQFVISADNISVVLPFYTKFFVGKKFDDYTNETSSDVFNPNDYCTVLGNEILLARFSDVEVDLPLGSFGCLGGTTGGVSDAIIIYRDTIQLEQSDPERSLFDGILVGQDFDGVNLTLQPNSDAGNLTDSLFFNGGAIKVDSTFQFNILGMDRGVREFLNVVMKNPSKLAVALKLINGQYIFIGKDRGITTMAAVAETGSSVLDRNMSQFRMSSASRELSHHITKEVFDYLKLNAI